MRKGVLIMDEVINVTSSDSVIIIENFPCKLTNKYSMH